MSGIVLSASVRQNLLSLQSTAALLATTQNDLATGNKVNSALDNPTEYFTAQGLTNRASDISNLLDGIGNGVQVLQAANTVLASLTQASTTLRTEASALGSNLSVVQIRQDFNKNLINVLQTGASNLTLADPNEEAANSQALSTRQSIAVSALSLANTSQQSVLQLLR